MILVLKNSEAQKTLSYSAPETIMDDSGNTKGKEVSDLRGRVTLLR